MEIVVSNLPYQGLYTNRLIKLPHDIGIEIYSEAGSEFWWDRLIPKLMENRTGPLTVHGPYQNIDLSFPALDFESVKEFYIWNYRLCQKYGVKHCVCHPYSYTPIHKMTLDEVSDRKKVCRARVEELNQIAAEYDIELLVENMADKDGLLSQKDFADLFLPVDNLNFLIDTGHMNIAGWDMQQMFAELGSRIHGYHINDNFGDGDSHLMVGEGSVDWPSFFALYKQYTPTATLVCEYAKGTIEELVASVNLIRKYLSNQ